MKRFFPILMILILTSIEAESRYNPRFERPVTKEELVGFVKEAIAFINIYGKEKALAEFNDKKGLYNRGELYIFGYDYKCKVLAHGANPGWAGKDFTELKDPMGKLIIQEMVKIVRAQGKGWIDYNWFHPNSKKIVPKIGYVHKVDENWWIGSGSYASE